MQIFFDIDFWLGAAAGLIVGWNFLPQPEWVARALNAMAFWRSE